MVTEDLLPILIAHHAGMDEWICLEPGVRMLPRGAQQPVALLRIGAILDGVVRTVAAVGPTSSVSHAPVTNLDTEAALDDLLARHGLDVPVSRRFLPAYLGDTHDPGDLSEPSALPIWHAPDVDAAIGRAPCPHRQAYFLLADGTDLSGPRREDTALVVCPDCADGVIAALPLHRVMPNRISDADLYLRRENARAALRDEAAVGSIADLIARDGRVSKDPRDHVG